MSAPILLAGRALLGGGESFVITGALGWGMALAGPQHTGKVIAWVGTAMYGAFAAGAPVGTALYSNLGFEAIAVATAFLPLVTLVLVWKLRSVAPTARARPAIWKVLGAVWLPGLGLALSSTGLGAITAFAALLFVERGWIPVWPAFTAFAVAFMLARVMFGHVVDRMGGARVALVCLVVEAAGQFVMWQATVPAVAVLGAAMTGLGYSLVYPGLGVEAVRAAPPQSRALAMGAYTACLDLALGMGMPALGLLATHTGLASVFLISAVLVASAMLIALQLLRAPA